MKPIATPYDRNSRLGLKLLTVNPCNQFIIQNLLRWKISVEKKGLNQFYTYNLSIESVRKYPLPILCYEQMKTMEGFGKFFCTAVAKLVRKHYKRGRMPTEQEKEQDYREHEEQLRRQMKKFKNSQKTKGQDCDQDVEQVENPNQNASQNAQDNDNDNDNQSVYSQFNDNFESQFPDNSEEGDDDDNQSQCSEASFKSAKSYKPKPGCESFNLLEVIQHIRKEKQNNPSIPAQQKSTISRLEINQYLYNKKEDKVRGWRKLIQKLNFSGYINVNPKDEDFISLTTKCRDYLMEVQESKKKGSNQNNNIVIFRKENLKENIPSIQKLSLMVNLKGSFKNEQIFIKTLSEDQRLKINQLEFEFASILWRLDEKIMDFMILRFRMQKFDLEEFNSHCLRAKNSQCSNIWIIFEYSALSKRSKKGQEAQVMNKLVSMSRAAGFKVLQFDGMSHTINFLRAATDYIVKRIQQNEGLFMLGTLNIFNQKNKLPIPGSTKQVFKNCLRCIPRIHRGQVENLSEKLPTFAIAHNYMNQLSDRNERLNFLAWMFRGIPYKPATIQIIDDILFDTNYVEEEEAKEIK